MNTPRRTIQIKCNKFHVEQELKDIEMNLHLEQQELIHNIRILCDSLKDEEWAHIKFIQDRKRQKESQD